MLLWVLRSGSQDVVCWDGVVFDAEFGLLNSKWRREILQVVLLSSCVRSGSCQAFQSLDLHLDVEVLSGFRFVVWSLLPLLWIGDPG
jgi:hypothetical protein